MQLVFYIVGKKNDDCYVLYDIRNGGKACASLYTIDQLIEQGYGIAGVNAIRGQKTRAKDITVVTLDGRPAQRISTFEDVPDTKRSAVTFIKGIKKSRDEIQKAKVIGEKRSQTLQTKRDAVDPRTTDDIEMYKDIIANGIDIKRLTLQKVALIYNYGKIREDRIYDFEPLYDKNGNPMPVYYSRTKNVAVSRKKTLERYADIVAKIGLDKGKYVNYSFYSHEPPHTTPYNIADYFMRHTTKQIKYTYGLKYRGPSTCEKPISHEEAMRIWSRKGMFDVREYDDWVDFQEVGANDMW